jgi:hypothetical protein
MSRQPKTPNIPPKEKAQKFLSNKSKDDAIKEITQLIYLSEDCDSAKTYWTDVLNFVNAHVIKKHAGYVW